MSSCPPKLRLSSSVCLHLLCLLMLFAYSSSTVAKNHPVFLQPNCTTACDDGSDSQNKTQDTGPLQNTDQSLFQSSFNQPSPPQSNSSQGRGSVASGEAVDPRVSPNEAQTLNVSQSHQQPLTRPDQPVAVPTLPAGTTSTTSAASTTAAPVPVTEAVSFQTISTTTRTMTAAETTTRTTTTTAAETTTTSTTTRTTTTTAAETTTTKPTTATTTTTAVAAGLNTTTTQPSVKTAISLSTTKTSPAPPPSTLQPRTEAPPVHAAASSSPTRPATAATSSASTAGGRRDNPANSGTRVSIAEVAGTALSKQLVDTKSLLAVLLFGLFFLFVTVALFVAQAYESYRRKDYTQVDYLINGMYTDSGV